MSLPRDRGVGATQSEENEGQVELYFYTENRRDQTAERRVVTVIAIDGPAGAGKSSLAQMLADALGFAYVDTGAMYRQIALALLDRGIDLADREKVEAVAGSLATELDVIGGDGRETGRLRDPRSGNAASVVARYPGVRRALAERQRGVAAASDVVMEGRDIGTVIAPDAEVKIYLTADRPVRARRRQQQLGRPNDADEVRLMEEDLAARDLADSNRPHSPLKPAADALVIDSSDRDLSSIVEQVLDVVQRRLRAR